LPLERKLGEHIGFIAELLQTLTDRQLRPRGETAQRSVDEVNHSRLSGPWCVVGWEDLRRDGLELGGFLGGEHVERPQTLRRRLTGVGSRRANRRGMEREPRSSEHRARRNEEISS
jgi:hypothetical protein